MTKQIIFDKNETWITAEKDAFQLVTVIGHLWYNKTVELVLFRHQLLNVDVNTIINYHDYSQNIIKTPVTVQETLEIAKEILKADIYRSRLDIGTLAFKWKQVKEKYVSISDFIADELKDFIGEKNNTLKPKDVILYGFGRIGRLLARELIYQIGKGEQLRLRAIVTRSNGDKDIQKRAALLRIDSIHGDFKGIVKEDYENKQIIINGIKVDMIASNDPSTIDYTKYGIDNAILIDNTGVWRDRKGLGLHLKAKGVDKVLLTAPGKDDIPNIVYGVNHFEFEYKKEQIFSAASCTTNAIVPVLHVIESQVGIEKGHLETIHSYTNDQNLIDNYHKKYRRGRGAPLNMVITETGASKAAAKVIPSLKGKLTANAVRVPTPNGSLAILMLTLKKKHTVDSLNALLEKAAHKGKLVEEIEYSYSHELVSVDIIGTATPAIVDSNATKVSADGKNAVVYVWYDNEYGYSRQVMRLAKKISGVRLNSYY